MIGEGNHMIGQGNHMIGQGNHMIIVTPSFSKSSVFKIFSLHTRTQSRRFQIPLV